MQMINEADLGITASDILNQDYQNRCLQWKPIPLSKDEMPVVVPDIPIVETEKLENVLWEDLRQPRGTGELVMMRDYLDTDTAEPSAGITETAPAVMPPMRQVEPMVETGVRVAENRGEELQIVKTTPKTDVETGETGETEEEEIVETETHVGERMDSERQTEELTEEEEAEEEELVIVVEFDRTGEHVEQREPGEQTEEDKDKDKDKEEEEEGKASGEEGEPVNSNGNNSLNEKKSKKELKKEKKEQKRREKEEKKKKKKEERNPKENIVVDSCVITMPEFR